MKVSQVLTLGIVLTLTGCAGNGIKSHIQVNNEDYTVEQLRSNPKAYQAHPSNLWRGGFFDPAIFGYNIIAIEKVTGCKVVRETIMNKGALSSAVVDCKK